MNVYLSVCLYAYNIKLFFLDNSSGHNDATRRDTTRPTPLTNLRRTVNQLLYNKCTTWRIGRPTRLSTCTHQAVYLYLSDSVLVPTRLCTCLSTMLCTFELAKPCTCTHQAVYLYPPGCILVPTRLCTCTHQAVYLYAPGCVLIPTRLCTCTHQAVYLYPPDCVLVLTRLCTCTHRAVYYLCFCFYV